MAKMSFAAALKILGLASIDNMSAADLKKLKRVMVKFYHPDRKTNPKDKALCEQKMSLINCAFDVVEKEMKLHPNGRRNSQHSSYSQSRANAARATQEAARQEEARRRYEARKEQEHQERIRREEKRRRYEETKEERKAARAQTRRHKRMKREEQQRREEAERVERERLAKEKKERELKAKKEALKNYILNRKCSPWRIAANYAVCTLFFWFLGHFAFIMGFLIVALDYFAFKNAWSCTTKPYESLGGLIEGLKNANITDKKKWKKDTAPSFYPFSRFFLDLMVIPIMFFLLVFLALFVQPLFLLALILLVPFPYYFVWRIYSLWKNSFVVEEKYAEVLNNS